MRLAVQFVCAAGRAYVRHGADRVPDACIVGARLYLELLDRRRRRAEGDARGAVSDCEGVRDPIDLKFVVVLTVAIGRNLGRRVVEGGLP